AHPGKRERRSAGDRTNRHRRSPGPVLGRRHPLPGDAHRARRFALGGAANGSVPERETASPGGAPEKAPHGKQPTPPRIRPGLGRGHSPPHPPQAIPRLAFLLAASARRIPLPPATPPNPLEVLCPGRPFVSHSPCSPPSRPVCPFAPPSRPTPTSSASPPWTSRRSMPFGSA